MMQIFFDKVNFLLSKMKRKSKKESRENENNMLNFLEKLRNMEHSKMLIHKPSIHLFVCEKCITFPSQSFG